MATEFPSQSRIFPQSGLNLSQMVACENKIATRRIRLLRKVEIWNERSQRLFACWCVRQIWHLLTDECSRNAVEVAERYANGGATKEELDAAWGAAWAAARAAAWDAAWASARDAARDVARAAQNKHLVEMLGLE